MRQALARTRSWTRLQFVALPLGLLLVGLAVLAGPGPDAGAAPSNRVTWGGEERFLGGANVPWFNWACDFGCGASGGVSDPAVRTALDERFRRFRATGLDTLRWWMFEPGPGGTIAQIRPGPGGTLEVSPTVYADIDAALQLAEQHDLHFVFVLFAGVGADHMPPGWVNDPAQRQQLASALGTLFARYGNSERILAWDIFNEPEWQIWNGLASEQNAVALARLIEQEVHARSRALVTLGQATLDGIPMWQSVRIDFHSPHWYSSITSGGGCAGCRDYASVSRQYGTTVPVVIGEWDAPDSALTDQRWRHWFDAGYAGAWAWSLFPERTNDRIPMGYASASAFAAAHQLARPVTSTPVGPPTTPGAQLTAGPIPASGSVALLVLTAGSSPTGLVEYLSAGGCRPVALALLQGGAWRVYVTGAPSVVNSAFPATLQAGVPLFVRCA